MPRRGFAQGKGGAGTFAPATPPRPIWLGSGRCDPAVRTLSIGGWNDTRARETAGSGVSGTWCLPGTGKGTFASGAAATLLRASRSISTRRMSAAKYLIPLSALAWSRLAGAVPWDELMAQSGHSAAGYMRRRAVALHGSDEAATRERTGGRC